MVTLELTENEAKVVQNELWLRLHLGERARLAPTGAYLEWLNAAHDKVTAAIPKPPEFADNH